MIRAAHEVGLDISEYFNGDALFVSPVEINDTLGKERVISAIKEHRLVRA